VVCIDNRLPTHEAIDASRRFAVNVLGERDEALARRFARPAEDSSPASRCSRAPIRRSSPRRSPASCARSRSACRAATTRSFVGRVLSCAATPGRRPLLYFRSSFGALRDPHAEFLDEAAGWDAGSLGGLGHVHVRPQT
jgi:flavin reductase (DIM6/NTAB) family NADH-FMN oxidoreductase RutF